jgi:hypothetical protein
MKEKRAETSVTLVICTACNTGIFSVSVHDFHYCPCGSTFVDGGFDYIRFGYPPGTRRPRTVTLKVPQSMKELLNDQATAYPGIDSNRKYGILSWDEVRKLYRSQFKKDIRLVARKTKSQEER